jgi:hypothetical protein
MTVLDGCHDWDGVPHGFWDLKQASHVTCRYLSSSPPTLAQESDFLFACAFSTA